MSTARKNIRRRSNWYIYLISFAATFVLLGLFILAFWDRFFPERPKVPLGSRGVYGYTPEEELNVTVMFMMSQNQGSVPDWFLLMNYRPRDGKIVMVPLKPETFVSAGGKSGKLTDMYRQGGVESVVKGVENTFKLKCGYYVKFGKSSFVNFVGLFGDVSVNIPFDLDDGSGIAFKAGPSELSSTDLYNYITFPKYGEESEDYRLVVIGSSFTALVKSAGMKNLSSERIQGAFNKIINTADTDLTFADFLTYSQALVYNSENGIDNPTYYIPFGEYDDSGRFIVAQEAINAILDKFKL